MMPASAGPTISMSWKLIWFSASPAVTRPAGSSAGVNVLRAGRSTALIANCTATSRYSSQTWPSPANAWAASAADTPARQLLVTRTTLRRSSASVSGPPSRPTASVGTACTTPRKPTANGDRVRS